MEKSIRTNFPGYCDGQQRLIQLWGGLQLPQSLYFIGWLRQNPQYHPKHHPNPNLRRISHPQTEHLLTARINKHYSQHRANHLLERQWSFVQHLRSLFCNLYWLIFYSYLFYSVFINYLELLALIGMHSKYFLQLWEIILCWWWLLMVRFIIC